MTPKELIPIRRDQEVDEARAVQWLRDTPADGVAAIWLLIQSLGDPANPNLEIVSRFAQLGFTHAVLLAHKKPTGETL